MSQVPTEKQFLFTYQKMSHIRTYAKEKLGAKLPHPLPSNIEKSIFNWAISRTLNSGDSPSWESVTFRECYKNRLLTIIWHLQNPAVDLIQRLAEKKFKSTDIVNMTPAELWPNGPYGKEAEKKKVHDAHLQAINREEKDTYTGIFKCGKCKSMKTTYTQAQTRSADEPMTTFVCCMACGNRWRFS
jgi:DNA-directed RNA polymerase subunit M/transcription elongation factor TFIIS